MHIFLNYSVRFIKPDQLRETKDSFMLGEEILVHIELVKDKFKDDLEKIIEYAISNNFSRFEAFILLSKGGKLDEHRADQITKNHQHWSNTNLSAEFEEVCFYDDVLSLFD